MLLVFLGFIWLLSIPILAQVVVAGCKAPDPLIEDREVERLEALWLLPFEGSERV